MLKRRSCDSAFKPPFKRDKSELDSTTAPSNETICNRSVQKSSATKKFDRTTSGPAAPPAADINSQVEQLKHKENELNDQIDKLKEEGYCTDKLNEFIQKLHEYNDLKDIGLALFGQLALLDNVPVKELYESLIFDFDNNKSTSPIIGSDLIELTFDAHPIDFKLDLLDNRLTVIFGQRDGVKVGYIVTALNNEPILTGGKLESTKTAGDGANNNVVNVMQILSETSSYPLTLKFAKPQLNTNEKIILSSMFHSLHAIAAQLSPVPGSSGIESLDTDSYRLQCYQTLTGLKLVAIADQSNAASNLDQFLKKLHELYADFALKNPFYSLEMPIRCELFDQNVKSLLDRFEKSGVIYV